LMLQKAEPHEASAEWLCAAASATSATAKMRSMFPPELSFAGPQGTAAAA
jgi:hypothetical protein